MKTMMPAFGIGRTGRPAATGGLGYAPIGSVLPSVGQIISDEYLDQIPSIVPQGLTSARSAESVVSEETAAAIIATMANNLIAALPTDMRSKLPDDIVGEEPGDIESEEPI